MSLVGFNGKNHPGQIKKRGGAIERVDDRATPVETFAPLQERFGFTLDVAASPHNAKCADYYTMADDAFTRPWTGRVWCNPPYSDLARWLERGTAQWRDNPALELLVMLLPANRTEQAWWHEYVEPFRDGRGPLRVEFLRRRREFIVPGGAKVHVPFGVCLVIWGPR